MHLRMHWLCSILMIALAGCVAPLSAAAPRPVNGPLADGRKVYVAKCAKCHKFYDPANYSDEEWKVWMGKMSRKAKLKPEQEAAVSEYIDKMLREPKGGNAKSETRNSKQIRNSN